MPKCKRTPADRLWSRVEVAGNGCWEFAGHRQREGYGRISVNGTIQLAHRFAYQLTHGDIPEAMLVRHRCDNPPCINPSHLELGTPADNMRDRDSRGRGAVGSRSGRTRLTERDVSMIREMREQGLAQGAIGALFGVSQSTISRITKGQTWRAA